MYDLLVGERRFYSLKAAHRRSGELVVGKVSQSQQNRQAQQQRAAKPAQPAQPAQPASSEQQQSQPQQQLSAVNWETSNPKVATVEPTGNGVWVTGVSEGTASIEATFVGDLGDGTRQERAGIAVTVRTSPHRSGAWIDAGDPSQ